MEMVPDWLFSSHSYTDPGPGTYCESDVMNIATLTRRRADSALRAAVLGGRKSRGRFSQVVKMAPKDPEEQM